MLAWLLLLLGYAICLNQSMGRTMHSRFATLRSIAPGNTQLFFESVFFLTFFFNYLKLNKDIFFKILILKVN